MMSAIPGQPAMARRLHEVTAAFMEEFLPWAVLEPEYVRIYQEVFTEPELHQLIAFYSTPIGRKLVEATPQVATQTVEMTSRVMAPHMPELQRRISALIRGGQSPQ